MRESQIHNRMTQAVATEEDTSSTVVELLLSFSDVAQTASQIYRSDECNHVQSNHRRRERWIVPHEERSFESPRLPDPRPAEAQCPMQARNKSHRSVRDDHREDLKKLEPE